MALGRTLALVPPGEVEGLDQLVGGREDHLQPVQHVGTRTGVGHRVAAAESAACHGLELGDEGESRLGVGSGQPEPVVSGVEGVPDEAGRPGQARGRGRGPRTPPGGRAGAGVRRSRACSPSSGIPGPFGTRDRRQRRRPPAPTTARRGGRRRSRRARGWCAGWRWWRREEHGARLQEWGRRRWVVLKRSARTGDLSGASETGGTSGVGQPFTAPAVSPGRRTAGGRGTPGSARSW